MWGKKNSKRALPLETGSILSISGLGRKHHVTESNWTATARSWNYRASGRGEVSGSITGSARDDGLYEVIANHEQLISSITEKLLALEDGFGKLQTDVLPALKVICQLRHAQEVAANGNGAPDTQQISTDQQLDPSYEAANAAAAAPDIVVPASPAKCTADCLKTAQQASLRTPRAEAAKKRPAAAKGPGCQGIRQGHAEDIDQAVTRALNDLARWGTSRTQAKDQGLDRDDCVSMRSFCTTISCGSTQVSGPAYMTDMRPAAKAASRAPQQYVHEQSAAHPGWGQTDYFSSWPLQQGLDEEASPEEIKYMIELITRQQPANDTGASSGNNLESSNSDSGDDGQQQTLDVQRQTISCLALHAERDEEVRQQLCTPQLLSRLTDMIKGRDLGCCRAAAHLLWYISRSDSLRQHVQQQQGLLLAVLSLLSTPDAATARAAAFALNNLAHDITCRNTMVNEGAVAGLVEMLSGCDALGQEAGAAVLMMLASEEGYIRANIVQCNGVQALVAVLKYGGPAAQEAAASALENLSLDSECEAALAAEGAVEGLLQVLKDGTTGAQAAAAGALRNLAVNEELEGHLLAAGMVQELVAIVSSNKGDVGVRTVALEGLRNLAASSTHAGDVLIQAGGAAALVDAARSLPAACARSAALGGLLVLSMDDNHRMAIMTAGAAGVLVHAALSGSPLAKEYAARGLANLASSAPNRLDLLKEGAATVLSFLLKSQVAALAALALAPASTSSGSQQGVVTAASSGSSGGCCLAAARALQNLAKCRSGSKQLLDAGCVPPLVSALAFPGLIATAAASALCNLCTNRRSLQDLADCEGCSNLIAAVAQPKHLTPRGQRQGLRLLRRLVKGPVACRAVVQAHVAALGLQLV